MTFTFHILTPNILMVAVDFVSVLVAKGEKLAVLDSGYLPAMPEAIRPALAHLGCDLADIDYVINTHGHWDHVQGNQAIVAASGAEVWIPAGEAEKLTVMADHFLAPGDQVDLGAGVNFDVIGASGHAQDMVCFYHAPAKLLFASDAAQGYAMGIPLMFHSAAAYLNSIRRLQELPIETLVLGHQFGWSETPAFIHRGQAAVGRYLDDCYFAAAKCRAAIAEAVARNPEWRYEDIVATTLQLLRDDPTYLVKPPAEKMTWSKASIVGTLRDLGVRPDYGPSSP